MRYIALEEAFSMPELTDRQPPPWPANRFSRRLLADWARKLPDFTEYRLPERDAAGIDVQVLSLTVPGRSRCSRGSPSTCPERRAGHDKPAVTLQTPRDPDLASSFLNIRVSDIQAVYADWTARGAEFLTPPKQHKTEIRCYLRDPDGYLIEVGQTTLPGGWRQFLNP